MSSDQNQTLPPQVQDRQPGHETEMNPRPDCEPRYPGSNRLQGKIAVINTTSVTAYRGSSDLLDYSATKGVS